MEESEQKKNSKMCMKTQKTPNSQSSFKRENKAPGITYPDFKQFILQSYSHQNSMVLVQKQIHRCQYLYQNNVVLAHRELRNNGTLIYDKRGLYNRGKTASSIELGKPQAKESNWTTFSYHIQKQTQNRLRTYKHKI